MEHAQQQVAFFQSIGPGDELFETIVDEVERRGDDDPQQAAQEWLQWLVIPATYKTQYIMLTFVLLHCQVNAWKHEVDKYTEKKSKKRMREDNTSKASPELSKYEMDRLENIKRNQDMLESLGLLGGLCTNTYTTEKERKAPRKKHEKFIAERRELPARTTRSNTSYAEINESIREVREPRQRREPKPRRQGTRSNDEPCMIKYESIPQDTRDTYSLRISNNDSGYYYVHKGSKWWQCQIHVDQGNGNKVLVHHGMYDDVRTAALAQSIARTHANIGQISNGGKHAIERAMNGQRVCAISYTEASNDSASESDIEGADSYLVDAEQSSTDLSRINEC